MGKISEGLVKTISRLAKLNLTDKQIEKYTKDLSSVVGYMEEIKNLDVKKITETSRVNDEDNILRNDEIKPSLSQKEALKNCKNTHNGYFLVPAIFKGD